MQIPVGTFAVATTFGILMASLPLSAQSLSDFPQLSFSPPGARALGMGTAFIGLADDATASETNPAGLRILSKPEFSLHGRFARFSENFVFGTESSSLSDSGTSPSYASIVFPLKRVTFSAYYRESVRFDRARESREEGSPYVSEPPFPLACPGLCLSETASTVGYTVRHLGISAAANVGSRLAVGASIRGTRYGFQSSILNRSTLTTPSGINAADSRPVPRVYPAATVLRKYTEDVDNTDQHLTFVAGVLINPGRRCSVGGVFQKGHSRPEDAEFDEPGGFDFAGSGTFQEVAGLRESFLNDSYVTPGTVQTFLVNYHLGVPDAFGGGIAVRPTNALTLTADVLRVKLSQTGEFFAGDVGGIQASDLTNFSGGLEYAFFPRQTPVFVRAGYLKERPGGASFGGQTATSFTGGVGAVFGGRFQVDAAVRRRRAVVSENDVAPPGTPDYYRFEDRALEVVLSLIVRLQ
jgi:hypothetical protein